MATLKEAPLVRWTANVQWRCNQPRMRAARSSHHVLGSLLRQSLETAELRADGWHDVGRGPGSSEGDFID
jgi:hypothetical protein